MYNRYIRNDHGSYTRVPQEDPQRQPSRREEQSPHSSPQHNEQAHRSPPPPKGPQPKAPLQAADSLAALLRHGLDRLHLDHVDTGDLLLLGLLFFLFREDADEELLVALGLLLIL